MDNAGWHCSAAARQRRVSLWLKLKGPEWVISVKNVERV